ncbi:hypothetical protein J2Y45_000398 [Dyadobacter sp. BE34]|uniref:Uncharacterized protein n=1 Tax=Dyadobacter fermentans TaxID=94254 RepID=A0ABU1QPP9_9BACT|nr:MULTISPECIES: hypothetical protein [Dyadobacter]MDR6803128.1 hypothetical protein [Dyadobacter fermentans]MDR7040870.1 hypothetical protein [Dyadobacter sp. BE242]MDR7195272.1 hypothetical protein [Dyadobacter sp. BE34]MDR7214182.1 hypothetical protein [Dyadobacter sp. BE31]MDR7260680.1 hypothetical protein [Dyadobacter sp. BE32]
MKAKSVKEIEKLLSPISDAETIEVNLKQLLLVYRAIEDWRGFFHNPMHYPTVEDVSKYLGNRRSGMYAVMDHIYMKTFEQLLPSDIEDRLEELL